MEKGKITIEYELRPNLAEKLELMLHSLCEVYSKDCIEGEEIKSSDWATR